eukprot:473297_1
MAKMESNKQRSKLTEQISKKKCMYLVHVSGGICASKAMFNVCRDEMPFDQFWTESSKHLPRFYIWILWQIFKHRFERDVAAYLFRKRPRLTRKRLPNERI